jgi:starch synthase
MPRVLMVAAEAAPFAKTGGLADVMGSLPPALARLGERVAVVVPRYASAQISTPERIWDSMSLVLGSHVFVVAIDQIIAGGVRYLFVDYPPFYGRAGIYGESGRDYADNHLRFAVLNQAAIGIARNIFRTDIFHAHDWQAGMVATYLRENFATDPTFFGAKCILTIHNLGYQGNFPPAALADLGLSRSLFHPAGLEFWGEVSFLKAGIVWSDAITTVSPTYAREIQTPEYGAGMDGILRDRAEKITGILNGGDYNEWNPEKDPHLVAPYSARDLAGKRAAKKALLEEMGLPVNEARPLIGIVSRFVGQKGFDLMEEIAGELGEEDMALVALGSGEPRFEAMFRVLAKTYPEKFAVRIGFDNALAHRIEAGADMVLMPSRYEPCGLTQIYSLRYGTVPIVRATGGLDDTVDETTGFKFREYTGEALLGAIREALAAWANREAWEARMWRGMARDFSWDASASEYKRLYESL